MIKFSDLFRNSLVVRYACFIAAFRNPHPKEDFKDINYLQLGKKK